MTSPHLCRLLFLRNRFLPYLLVLVGILGLLSATVRRAHSSPGPEAVQVLTGYLDPGERQVYNLPNLKKNDTLSVYLTRLSGNLDPLVAVADTKFDLKSFDALLMSTLQKSPENPVIPSCVHRSNKTLYPVGAHLRVRPQARADT